MHKATLTRNETIDGGCFGTLITDTGYTCRTAELPWVENETDKSCIPMGQYICTWRTSPTHGYCYHVENVPNRTDIEIHAGNVPGIDSKGCILPGKNIGLMNGKQAVLFSRQALTELEAAFRCEPFQLTVKDA